MKQTLLLVAGICSALSSFATNHIISTGSGSGFSFSPSSITDVHLGDTVTWQWVVGTHNTTSTSVPSGAATWAHDINSGSTTFMYVPAVVGTYTYECTIHAPGMAGSFVVSAVSAVPAVTPGQPLFSVSPNPARETVHLQFSNSAQPVTVEVFDLGGRKLTGAIYNSATADLNLNNIPAGLYVIMATNGTNVYRQELVIQ